MKNALDDFDCVIVGAGPAGSAAAIELGKKRLQVLLLERGGPDKDKACGDAFLHTSICELEALGLNSGAFISMGGTAFDSISLMSHSRVIWKHSMRQQTGWLVPRKRMDQRLREIASENSILSYHSKVVQIDWIESNRWKITYKKEGSSKTVYSRTVILATGSANKFSSLFGVTGDPIDSISVSCYTSLKESESVLFEFIEECLPGYGWIFPYADGQANIGVCSLNPSEKSLRSIGDRYLVKWNIHDTPYWRGGSGPLWSGKGKNWHHPMGLLSCGDAAGLIDPINGEGISAALYSGRKSAATISQFLNDGQKPEHLSEYSATLLKSFTSKYAENLERSVWNKICFR